MSTPALTTQNNALITPSTKIASAIWGVLPMMKLRSRRVIFLGMAIALMSAVDLYLTLLYVMNMGMNEMNPLARAMMSYDSPAILAVWKCATVVLSVGILLWIRTKRSAELGAWVGFFVLGWLMTHWVVFINETRHFNLEIIQEIAQEDSTWVVFEQGVDPFSRGQVIID